MDQCEGNKLVVCGRERAREHPGSAFLDGGARHRLEQEGVCEEVRINEGGVVMDEN